MIYLAESTQQQGILQLPNLLANKVSPLAKDPPKDPIQQVPLAVINTRPAIDLNSVAAPVASQPIVQQTPLAGVDNSRLGELTQIASNYGPEDPITYLDYSSISDQILHRNTANFVFFNANFNSCRNCNKFFDIWKDLAIDIRWWKQVIRLFSINCSEEDNIEVCRRAGVTQFPQVKYYWIMSSSLNQDGQRLRILGKSVHALRHLVTDKVFDSYTEHTKLLAQRKQTGSTASNTNPLSLLLNSMGGLNSDPIKPLMSLLGGGDSKDTGLGGISQLMSMFMGSNPLGVARQRLDLQPIPNNWPELEPIEASNAQQLIQSLPLKPDKSNVGALVIMETQEFLYNGLEVMLDLSPYSSLVYVARIRDDRSQLTKNITKRDDIQAPALIYFTPSKEPKLIATGPKLTNDEDLRRVFVRAFERRQVKYPVKRVWVSTNSSQFVSNGRTMVDDDEELLQDANHVYINDLYNALRASLMDQVFRHPDLSDDQHNSLVKYIYAVINYFPFQDDNSLKFLKRLHAWLQNQVSPVDIGDYKKQFRDVDEFIPKKDWIACKSLTSSKSMPGSDKKFNNLLENPAQIGKMVSNMRRLMRNQQQQGIKLGGILNAVSTTFENQQQHLLQKSISTSSVGNRTTTAPDSTSDSTKTNTTSPKPYADSFIDRIIKTLLKNPISSDSSVLKLIANTLYGGKDFVSDGARSAKFTREYPCGAWKLAHVMVINEYLKESPRKDVKHIALHSLHQYMLNFYACSMCGNRVSDVSNEFRYDLDYNLRDQSDSIMLLWKFHNRVNKRLEGESRPNSPHKSQFPSESLCPKCRNPKVQGELTTTPNWHEKQVLNFLVHHYRPQNILLKSSDQSSASRGSSRLVWVELSTQGPIFITLITTVSIALSSLGITRFNWIF